MKKMYVLQYEARPTADNPEFKEVGGAIVNCYIQAESESAAGAAAQKYVEESGWQIIAVEEEPEAVDREYFIEDYGTEYLEYFDQAVIDGQCYVFHTWGPESQEGDVSH